MLTNAERTNSEQFVARACAVTDAWKKALAAREKAWIAFQNAAQNEMIAREALTQISTDDTHLSPRQTEVLKLVSDRLSNKEIASKLNISERTVKFHVSALLTIFQKQSRHDLPSVFAQTL